MLGPHLGRSRVETVGERPFEHRQREPRSLSIGEVEPVLVLLDDAAAGGHYLSPGGTRNSTATGNQLTSRTA